MKRIGYVYGLYDDEYVKKQYRALQREELDTILIEENSQVDTAKNNKVLDEIIITLKPGDQLVVYELECIGKAIVQLGIFLENLRKKQIELIVLNKKVLSEEISDFLYSEMIIRISEAEKSVISERTTRGLEAARRKGRIGGRPKVSEDTIKKIRYLYKNQSYTLREIAEECNVSLGTAYKYVQNEY